MSDDNSHSANGSSRKTWIEKLGQIFQGEPKNREQLVEVIQEATDRDLIDNETRSMIEGVLEVSAQRVRDIMIPRSQMVTIDKNLSLQDLLPIVVDSAHSRFPVINEDKDHVEGILLAKDLIGYTFHHGDDPFDLEKILRPAVIVPESKRIDKLLKEFRSERYHMAIVVDEFGGVSGLVTIEDILELIVGEIEDEYDEQNHHPDDIRRINRLTYSVRALTEIEDFNAYFGSRFSDEEVDTIGGLVMHGFGHLPRRGEVIELDEYVFKVVSTDKRRLLQVQVTLPENHPLTLSENQPTT